jgi:hypothetical protein
MNIFVKANKIYILLLSLLALGLLSACYNPAPTTNIPKEPLGPPDRVDVVYFYKGEDCHCQEVVGENIQATLFVNYNIELTSGKLTFQSLNLDDKKNATIAYKYDATPVSLFINIVRADREHIIAVPEIFLVKDDDEALDKLVNTRIQQALDGEE